MRQAVALAGLATNGTMSCRGVQDEFCRKVINTSKPIKDVATAYGVGPEHEYIDSQRTEPATLNSGVKMCRWLGV